MSIARVLGGRLKVTQISISGEGTVADAVNTEVVIKIGLILP